MAIKSVNVILDTNWYVSASINRTSRRRLYQILQNPKLKVFYSEELLAEYKKVMSRPYFRKIISDQQVKKFLNLILPKLSEASTGTKLTLSRDLKDDYLLAMARACDADYLVTGDDDLLILKEIGNTKIVRMSEFRPLISA